MPTYTLQNGTFQPGTNVSASYTCPKNVHGLNVSVTTGQVPDPASTFALIYQLDRQDGHGWIDVGGLTFQGGLVPSQKGGPADTPASGTSVVHVELQQDWQVRASLTIGGTASVTATGSVTTF